MNRAAERARSARQQADETRREYDRLQSAMPRTTSQPERLRIAEQLSHLHPDAARRSADDAQRQADDAARRAQQAEERAARSEAQANALYDAMMEIYQAWERCARNCVEQARTIDRVAIDPHHIFPVMPQSPPRPPPFYRPAPTPVMQGPRPQQTAVRLDPFESRILAIHNVERAAVGAPPLRWNPALEGSATAYAQQLARTGQIAHSPRAGRGIERENLQKARIGWSADRMMRDWVSEKRLFRPGIFPAVCSGDWSLCGHYTQVIWPTTTDVGCGRARGRGFEWFVCRYSPGGNKDGKPVGGPPVRPAVGTSDPYQMILETGDNSRVVGGDWIGPAPARPDGAPPKPEASSSDQPKAVTPKQ